MTVSMAKSENRKPEFIEPNLRLGVVVHDGDSPNLETLRFRLESYANTYAGRLVQVEVDADVLGRVVLVARVENVFEINPHESPEGATVRATIPVDIPYAEEGRSTVIYRIAHASSVEEVVFDDKGNVLKTRAPQSLPRAGSDVLDATGELVISAFGFEPDPSLSLDVGLVNGADISASLSRDVVQRHILITGGIGSGKSYTRGVLAEELSLLGVPQVNIDVNGELVDCAKELGGKNVVPGIGEFTLPLSALSSQDVIDTIPAINKGTNIETLVRHAHESLLRDRVNTRGAHFSVDDLCRKIEEVAPQLRMEAPSTLQPALLRARSLERLTYIGNPFPWHSELKPGAFVNVDCRGLLVSDLRLITASIARDLQRLATAETPRPFVVFSIDEFHLVAPNVEDTVTKQVLRELARLGRHLRLGLILTTQSPSDVDRAILKRLLTRFLHAIEPDQLDALRGLFSDAPESLIRGLPKMPRGRCVVTGAFETVKHAAVVDIRERATTDGGGSPPIWAELSESGWSGKKTIEDVLGVDHNG